jgi:hypothetical protein
MSEQEHPPEEPAEPLDTGLSDESLPEIVIRIPVGAPYPEISVHAQGAADNAALERWFKSWPGYATFIAAASQMKETWRGESGEDTFDL